MMESPSSKYASPVSAASAGDTGITGDTGDEEDWSRDWGEVAAADDDDDDDDSTGTDNDIDNADCSEEDDVVLILLFALCFFGADITEHPAMHAPSIAGSSSSLGGCWPNSKTQEELLNSGFIVMGKPKTSLKKVCVGTLQRLMHALRQPVGC
jgi:hypothetical protein